MIEIVKAEMVFVDDIYRLENELFFFNKFSKAQIVQELEYTDRYYIVALHNDIVVGYAGINILPDVVELIKIAVSKEHQGKKIAQTMFENLKMLSVQKKHSKILLEVSSKNIPAIKFYKKNGFQNLHVRKGYYQDKSDGIVMELKF